MLAPVLALAFSSLAIQQSLPGQAVVPSKSTEAVILQQRMAEDQVAEHLRFMRRSAGLPEIKRVPASDSELQLTCTAALTDKQVYDPGFGTLRTYVTADLVAETEDLKLVALGTSQFPDNGPRRPVYSDKNWPRYSVVVFVDHSSMPGHTLYRVGVARRQSVLVELVAH